MGLSVFAPWRLVFIYNGFGLSLGLLSNSLLTSIIPVTLFYVCHVAGYPSSVSVQLPPSLGRESPMPPLLDVWKSHLTILPFAIGFSF